MQALIKTTYTKVLSTKFITNYYNIVGQKHLVTRMSEKPRITVRLFQDL